MVEELEISAIEREESALASCLGVILVVEDDLRMQKVLQRLFAGEHYHVVTAGDGKAGLAKFREQPPLAVILDLILPEISGRELCQRMKAISNEIPVIVLSAVAEVVEQGIAAGTRRR